jgi:hypothetical protein
MEKTAMFILGLVLGIFGTGIFVYDNEIAPLQMQVAKQESEETELRQSLLEKQNQIAAMQAQQAKAASSPGYALLDVIHPGLGAVAQKLQQFIPPTPAQPLVPPVAPQAFLTPSCPGGLWAAGSCVTCNPGLHPGRFPNGSIGCVREGQ